MSFWTPAIDPANPLASCHPERYALKRLDIEVFLGIDPADQSVLEVSQIGEAHHFLTHEGALRAATALNHLGRGPLDVVKLADPQGGMCDGCVRDSLASIGSKQRQPVHETAAPTHA